MNMKINQFWKITLVITKLQENVSKFLSYSKTLRLDLKSSIASPIESKVKLSVFSQAVTLTVC